MREWIWRAKALLGRRRMVAERAEELRFHFEMEVEAGIRQGLSADEARRRARLRTGGVTEALETTRENLGWSWLHGSAMDLRHAFRALTRKRAFGVVSVAVLATTIAVNTLVFCLLAGVVLRPLPYPSPERLVRLYDTTASTPKFPMSIGHYLDYRASARSLESLGLYTGRDMELTAGQGRSRRLTGVAITGEYFGVLGATPFLGRAFNDADLSRNIRHVILSYPLWRESFGSDRDIVGKVVRLDREPWTVIGVAPQGFQHVGGDYRSPVQGETVDIWVPLTLPQSEGTLRGAHFTNAVARIRKGFTADDARQELTVLAAAYAQRYPNFGDWGIRIESLLNEVTGRSRQLVWLLMAAGGLVLLVACANISGLSVARAIARRNELSLRSALGASRWQLIRVGLAENVLTGFAGASLGLFLAATGLPLVRLLLPADFPRAHEIHLTAIGGLFAFAVAMAAMVAAGLLSVHGEALQAHQRFTASHDSPRLRRILVAAEVALAGLLAAGTLFLLRSYQKIGERDHGFTSAGALTFQLSVPGPSRTKQGHRGRVYEAIRSDIAAINGVASAGASTNLPWSGYDENTSFEIVGQIAARNAEPNARYQAATAGYFEAAGMRLLMGRLFEFGRDGPGQHLTVIVNDALASRYFPQGNAVGALVNLWGEKRQIVGVIAGIKDSPADLGIKPAFWFPLGQVEFSSVFFVVRSSTMDPASLTAAVTAAVHAVDPELAVADVSTLERRTAAALAERRSALWLLQAFAGLALILAAAGVYGLLAYLVQQRRKELGIRVALGATRAGLWRMILADGVRIAAVGALCCVCMIPIGGFLMRAFLFNVTAFDPYTIIGAPAALLAVSVLASLGPARSATRSDPALTLRQD
jgi:predicted permease